MKTDNKTPIIIISGSMGSGKGTVQYALAKELNLNWISTVATRAPRPDDDVLNHYQFVTNEVFDRYLSRGDFFESVDLGLHRYGTLKRDIDHALSQQKPSVIELDVRGGIAFDQHYANVLLIFIQSSAKEREARIKTREMDPKIVKQRMIEANKEEAVAKRRYDYTITNVADHVDDTIESVKDLIIAHYPDTCR